MIMWVVGKLRMALLGIKNLESAIAPHKHTPAAGKDNNKPCCDEWMSYNNIVLSAAAPMQVGRLSPPLSNRETNFFRRCVRHPLVCRRQ